MEKSFSEQEIYYMALKKIHQNKKLSEKKTWLHQDSLKEEFFYQIEKGKQNGKKI